MDYAKVFQSGNSQAVRLPKEYRLEVSKVEILKRGNEIVLRPAPRNASAIFDALSALPEDFLSEGRSDALPQPRESL